MTMKKGKGAIVAKERGRNNVLKYYIEELKRRIDLEWTNFIIVGYTSDINVAKTLIERIKAENAFNGDIYLMQMGAVVGTLIKWEFILLDKSKFCLQNN